MYIFLKKSLFSIYYLLMVVILLMFCFAFIAKADFGQTCNPVPIEVDNDLKEGTAYGYILDNIDIKDHATDGCLNKGNELKFCIRNPVGSPDICQQAAIMLGESKLLEALSANPDIGQNPMFKKIELSAELMDSLLCLTMMTSRGSKPLICREINKADVEIYENTQLCPKIGADCYNSGIIRSQSVLNFSGLTVECMHQALNTVFFQGEECESDPESFLSSISAFSTFQVFLKNAVFFSLVLYTMFYGLNLAMNPGSFSVNTAFMAVLKIILVAYFAVGLGPVSWVSGKPTQENGMVSFALPFLLNAATDFAAITFNSIAVNGLCNFDINKYTSGYQFYRLWDSIDCRLSYYFMYSPLLKLPDFFSGYTSTTFDLVPSDALPAINVSNPRDFLSGDFAILSLVFVALLGGNLLIVILLAFIIYCLIGFLLHFLVLYIMCTITIYVMAYISPIFITFSLFEKTKSYFDSWLKVVVSCALQPAVAGGFLALLLTTYDSVYFGNCPFRRHDYSLSAANIGAFELRFPKSDTEDCESSVGYKIYRLINGEGWELRNSLLVEIWTFTDYAGMLVGLLYTFMFTFIFYYVFASVYEFAADITSGPRVIGNLTALPSYSKKDKDKDKESAVDKASTGATNEAKDMVSSGSGGSGGAADMVSKGGGAK